MTWHRWGDPVLYVVELDACGDTADLYDQAAWHGVHARYMGQWGHWPEYRYTGTRACLYAFLADQYEDGSGDPIEERFILTPAEEATP